MQPRDSQRRGKARGLGLAILACLASPGCHAPTSAPGPAADRPVAPAPAVEKSGRGIPSNWVSNPRRFAAGVRLAALAAAPTRLLGTTLGPAANKLVSFSETGEVEPFAPRFAAPADLVCQVAIAPGFGGFAPGDVFASRGAEIWRLGPDGADLALFATLPAGEGDVAGLCFDHVGSFDYELLVLSSAGGAYRLDAGGAAQRFGYLGPGGRGPSVASPFFGRLGGQLLAAFPEESEVRAIDAGGAVRLLGRWPGVSGAWSIPDEPRVFAHTGAALFIATGAGQMFRYPLADLTTHGGEVLLTSVLGAGSALVKPDGGTYRLRAFARYLGPEQAAACVRRLALTRVALEIKPGSRTVALGSTRLLLVGALASFDFTPASLDGTSLLFAGAPLVPRGPGGLGTFTDLNGDGVLDLVLQFRPSEMQLQPGVNTVTLEGATLNGERVRGSTQLNAQLP